MPIDLDELTPINPDDPKYLPMLANLQGNILKSHGRNHAVHLFLTFNEDSTGIRQWIADFAARFVTSALHQHYETKELRVTEISGGLFGGFHLSAKGYAALKLPDFDLEDFVEDTAVNNCPDVYFKAGMEFSGGEINDLPRNEWEADFRDNDIDALIILADDDAERLNEVSAQVIESLEKVTLNIFTQNGDVLRNEAGKPIEHFGFRDCISQPVFYAEDVEKARANGFEKWDSLAPLSLVLTKDPLSVEENCFGSYLVYRKLEQNVKKFKSQEAELAGAGCLNLAGSDLERAGALIVGRFRNGVPVELSAFDTDENLIDFNDFNFIGDDRQATVSRCPYQGHIRRMMPRGETGLDENGKVKAEELQHRIVRRGFPYDHRERDADGNLLERGDAEKDVGLLFICFQSSIPKQFGFVQAKWANTTEFFDKNGVGIDPIVGQYEAGDASEYQKWHLNWGVNEGVKAFNFESSVVLKGGEFFFTPSISFLRSLKFRVHA
jgi:Dyp-type peroxidase family